jgi:hypothetical protein
MKIHTGETLAISTQDWSWKERQELGQRYIKDLSEDLIQLFEKPADEYNNERIKSEIKELIRSLELDGYVYQSSKLLPSESDVLDVEEEKSILESLYDNLDLEDKDTAIHHLNLSEDHYIDEKWDDSISNSRKFLEKVLQEVAARRNMIVFKKNYQITPIQDLQM